MGKITLDEGLQC